MAMASKYDEFIHEFIDPRSGKRRFCVAEWNATAAKLERPLTAIEHRYTPDAYAVFASGSDAGMSYLGSVPTRRQALARARRIYGGQPR